MVEKNNKSGKLVAAFTGIVVFAVLVSVLVCVAVSKFKTERTEFEIVPPASGAGVGYYRHAYEDLNEDEKKVYSVVLSQAYAQVERIEIPALGTGELDNIFSALAYDNPDLFNLGTDCKAYVEGDKTFFEVEYAISYEEYKPMLESVNKVTAGIVARAKKYSTDYEKEKYVHDYIINNCSYAEPSESQMANTVYGCLVEGRASCEGYSRAFQYIMSALDIDNCLITGESADDGVNYVNHMWNYVILDGYGYFVDLTWDDPRTETDVLVHTYFNVTTADILLTHRNIKQIIPLCDSRGYNYYVYEDIYFEFGAGAAFADRVISEVNNALRIKSGCVELRFKDSETMALAKKSLFEDGVIYEIYRNAGLVQGDDTAQVYFIDNENLNTICLFL